MDLTIDQLLSIIGRLDDSPGFDTPRERFRRFLIDRVTSPESAARLIQQCREHSGEQSHRALQDAVVRFGRFLGFHPIFGRYHHDPGTTPVHGFWQSRRRLHVTLIVCSDQTPEIDLDAVSRGVAGSEGNATRIGLLITTPLYARKDRLERALGAGSHPSLRLLSLAGLLRLGAMVASAQCTHEDVLELLNPVVRLDARLDLLDRVATTARRDSLSEAGAAPRLTAGPGHHERRYWVNAMRAEPSAPMERIVGSLIGRRQILGINPAPGLEDRLRIGDAICVFITGRGIVAHGQIAGILSDGSRMIRDAQRFTHVLRLTDVIVYDTPVVPHPELARKLDRALMHDTAAVTTPISSREFEFIASHALSQAG